MPRSWSSPARPKARTAVGASPRNSPKAMASTETFIEWVVVYWSNSLSWSSGMTIACPPCMAIESERTTP